MCSNSGEGSYTFLTWPCLCDSYFVCLMAAISVFTTLTISKVVLNDTNMVTCRAIYLKPLSWTLIYVTSSYRCFLLCYESASILSKIIKKLFDTNFFYSYFVKWRPSCILATQLNQEYLENQRQT